MIVKKIGRRKTARAKSTAAHVRALVDYIAGPHAGKSARQSGQLMTFFLSENEARHSRSLTNYFFYLVVNADKLRPTVLAMSGRDLSPDRIVPVNYRVSVPVQ